jgi:hypothetical protein
MNKTLSWCAVMLCVLGAPARPAGQLQPTPQPTLPAAPALRALIAAPSRAMMLDSLEADKGAVRMMTTLKLDGVRLRQLPLKATAGSLSSTADVGWNAGVRFAFLTPVPQYSRGGSTYKVGWLRVVGAGLQSGEIFNTLTAFGIVWLTGTATMADVALELPPGEGSYLIAVKVVDMAQGRTLDTWLQNAEVTAVLQDMAVKPPRMSDLALCLLSDRTGFVALAKVNVTEPPAPTLLEGPDMRRTNTWIVVRLPKSSLFGGIVVTRL